MHPADIQPQQTGNAPCTTPTDGFLILAREIERKLGSREVYNHRYRERLEFYVREIPLARLLGLVKGSRARRSVAYFLTPATSGGICLLEDLRLRILEERALGRKMRDVSGFSRSADGQPVELSGLLEGMIAG